MIQWAAPLNGGVGNRGDQRDANLDPVVVAEGLPSPLEDKSDIPGVLKE